MRRSWADTVLFLAYDLSSGWGFLVGSREEGSSLLQLSEFDIRKSSKPLYKVKKLSRDVFL